MKASVISFGPSPDELRVEDLRDAEVDDLDVRTAVLATGEEQVRRLEVAMDDAVRVRLVERLADLQHAIDGVLDARAGRPP